ncbi:MAG: hypothetical protein M1827_006927 [Pycnora praestabilis]|nr:MAG: hypothetical protein M1827_006927 [Pycnora praestabilis]
MSETSELLAEIARVSGNINRHKNQTQSLRGSGRATTSGSAYPYRHEATQWRQQRGAPYARGRGRGGRALPPSHRNRTLVLNNTGSSGSITEPQQTDGVGDPIQPSHNAAPEPVESSTTWIARKDRHMQLINPSIYEKESQARVKAMEETRKLKNHRRNDRERMKINNHLQRLTALSTRSQSSTATSGSTTSAHEVLIHDYRFRVAAGGNKLLKVPDDSTSARSTPKKAIIAGVTFLRSKHGNLYRSGLVKSKRTSGGVKKISELCKRFTSTGTPFPSQSLLSSRFRLRNSSCSCSKGPLCLYTHDSTKVAVCKDFLKAGSCPAGDACDLSHESTPERVPACLHFQRGKCSNPECRYAHVRVNPGAPICRPFANLGYCEKGASCNERHVHECPDYANAGVCHNKKCRLPHVDRAGQIRKNAVSPTRDTHSGKEEEEDVESDLSSDEEDYDEIDSDDVDSDGLDDDLKQESGDADNQDVLQQQDFINL